MAVASSLNLTNVSSGLKSLRIGLDRVQNSTNNLRSVILNRTRVKREAITARINLNNKREENIRRRDQEDILESTGIKGIARRTGSIISDSSKGFLGRLLDFVSTLLVGWLLYNLPTILTAIKDLISRIQKLFGVLQGFMADITRIFFDFGNILSGVLYDVIHLDFFDSQRKVQNAMNDLGSSFDDMHKQFEDGMELLTKPLGEMPGEEPVPPTGTNYTTPAGSGSMAGGTNEQKTMSFLISSGLTQAQAAGVAGNIEQESHFDPNADNGTHHGIAQWDKKIRWPRVSAYIKSIGKDPNSLEGQLYGLVWEAQTRGDWRQMQGTKSSAQSAAKWLERFEISGEKPGQRGYENRMANAARLEAKYKNYNPQAQELKQSLSTKSTNLKNKGNLLSEYITGNHNDRSYYAADHDSIAGIRDNYHDHLAFKDKETTLRAYNFFKSKGFKVTEFGVSSGHSNGSLHYYKRAFDIPGAQWGGRAGTSSGPKEWAGSAKVKAALAEFLGTTKNEPQIANVPQQQQPLPQYLTTPERKGQEIIFIDDRQPQQPSGGGVASGGEQVPFVIINDVNSLIKRQMLLDLAYT
jgi:hypothetical protein